MKRLLCFGVSLLLVLACSLSIIAAEVPVSTIIRSVDGVQQCVKVYTILPGQDPMELIEGPFEWDGYLYSFFGIETEENYVRVVESHAETVSVETKRNDLSIVLDSLEPTMEYNDGIYTGVLNLDHTTIHTEAAGYSSGSYTLQDTREYDSLDSNDISIIPATVVKDGKTLSLSNVDWQVQGTELVGDELIPSLYKAVATYNGKFSYRTAKSYVTTAEYVGEISKNELRDITCTLTYIGSQIEEPEELNIDSQAESGQNDSPLRGILQKQDNTETISVGLVVIVVLIAAVLVSTAYYRRHKTAQTVRANQEDTQDEA